MISSCEGVDIKNRREANVLVNFDKFRWTDSHESLQVES